MAQLRNRAAPAAVDEAADLRRSAAYGARCYARAYGLVSVEEASAMSDRALRQLANTRSDHPGAQDILRCLDRARA
jgi:hypothetical protein